MRLGAENATDFSSTAGFITLDWLNTRIFEHRGFSPIIYFLYCSSVSCAASSGVLGQENVPSSSLFLNNSKNLLPSQISPMIRSARLPQKRNIRHFFE